MRWQELGNREKGGEGIGKNCNFEALEVGGMGNNFTFCNYNLLGILHQQPSFGSIDDM